jgi:hypothetical protein
MLGLLLYRVIQEEMSIFGEVILSVFVRKKIHMNMRLNLNGCGDKTERDYLEYLGVDGRIV